MEKEGREEEGKRKAEVGKGRGVWRGSVTTATMGKPEALLGPRGLVLLLRDPSSLRARVEVPREHTTSHPHAWGALQAGPDGGREARRLQLPWRQDCQEASELGGQGGREEETEARCGRKMGAYSGGT